MSDNTRRILFAGFFHETHTFVTDMTPLADFKFCRGADQLARAGDGSTIDGFLEVAAREKWDLVPTLDATALPSGTIDHAVFDAFWDELAPALAEAAGTIDGIWLALHGAAVTSRCDDVEGELLERLRRIPGLATLPVFGVFDLHATFTERMATHANGLVGYRENPHTDARAAAVLSAELLARALKEGVAPRMVRRGAPIVWPPTGTGTADEPMRSLEAAARAIEARTPSVWAVNVVAGFSFSDVADAGVAFSAIHTGSPEVAEAHLDELCGMAMEHRSEGFPDEWPLAEALARAAAAPQGPVVIVEPADNIGGGAPGDATDVLRALIDHKVAGAVVAIADRAAVAALADAAPGETRRITMGGRGSPLGEGPVTADVRLLRRTDGRFALEDRNSHLAASQGINFEMGPCAVVELAGPITVLLTSRKTPPFDLAQLRSQGIVPEEAAIIVVKAAVAHRRAYDKIAAASYTVRTVGPCTSDLSALPYRKLRRPVFPLDAV
ncbi:MAG: M81 family metallopeptidase [Acuticoccus sp.]